MNNFERFLRLMVVSLINGIIGTIYYAGIGIAFIVGFVIGYTKEKLF